MGGGRIGLSILHLSVQTGKGMSPFHHLSLSPFPCEVFVVVFNLLCDFYSSCNFIRVIKYFYTFDSVSFLIILFFNLINYCAFVCYFF